MAKYKLAYNSQTEKKSRPKGFDDFELKLGDTLRGERATLGKSLLEAVSYTHLTLPTKDSV